MIPTTTAHRDGRSVLLIDRGRLRSGPRAGGVPASAGLNLRVAERLESGRTAEAVVAPVQALAESMSLSSGSIFVGYGPPADMARALASGCRDYLCEPWEYDEMILRVLRCLDAENLPIVRGRLTVTPAAVECGGRSEPLSWQEYRIAELLLRHCGACVPREVFNRALWGAPDKPGRALDMQVSKLRGKLKAVSGGVDGIRGCRRSGYMLVLCE